MGKQVIETIMGAVVLLVAAGFLIFAYKSGNVASATGYKLYAQFDRVDGIGVGSDVRISGIKVGQISNQNLDLESYLAKVYMTIDTAVKIPEDSSAEIVSDGLLGSKYLSITPGGAEKLLNDGERIKYTQSSINIESLIGKFMYGGAGEETKEEESEPVEDSGHTNVLD